MSHNRKLVFGGVSLLNVKMPKNIGLMLDEIRNEMEAVFIESNFLSSAPFTYIGIVFRFGLKNDQIPEIRKVNKKHGDLPVATEVNVSEFIEANSEIQREMIREWAVGTVLLIAEKFQLPKAPIIGYAHKKKLK